MKFPLETLICAKTNLQKEEHAAAAAAAGTAAVAKRHAQDELAVTALKSAGVARFLGMCPRVSCLHLGRMQTHKHINTHESTCMQQTHMSVHMLSVSVCLCAQDRGFESLR